jgi:hypothetical protein
MPAWPLLSFVRGVSFTGQPKNFPIEKAVSGERQIISKTTPSSHHIDTHPQHLALFFKGERLSEPQQKRRQQ